MNTDLFPVGSDGQIPPRNCDDGVYLSEIATPGHKGFYVSWQSGRLSISRDIKRFGSQGAGLTLGSALE